MCSCALLPLEPIFSEETSLNTHDHPISRLGYSVKLALELLAIACRRAHTRASVPKCKHSLTHAFAQVTIKGSGDLNVPAEKKNTDLKKFIMDGLLPVLKDAEDDNETSHEPDLINPAWKKMPADVFKGTRNKTLGTEPATETKGGFG